MLFRSALRPIIPDNACILCLTAAAGTNVFKEEVLKRKCICEILERGTYTCEVWMLEKLEVDLQEVLQRKMFFSFKEVLQRKIFFSLKEVLQRKIFFSLREVLQRKRFFSQLNLYQNLVDT